MRTLEIILISKNVNINCLQKPIGNEELIQIVNKIISTCVQWHLY